MKNSQQPISAFEAHGGVANASQLLEEGVTYYQLKELLTSRAGCQIETWPLPLDGCSGL